MHRADRSGGEVTRAIPLLLINPATYTAPFSMKEYAHSQCRPRAAANIPGPRLRWL